MRRVLRVLTVALVMAAMLVMIAAPAMAQNVTIGYTELPSYNPCWPIATDPRCPTL
jgi:hypothetical protein